MDRTFEIKKNNLQKIGSSFYLCLPIQWVRHHRLKKGAAIKTILSESGDLILQPAKGATT